MNKVRQSNLELCRALSMFMILMLHANFVALGIPSKSDLDFSTTNVFNRFFLESLSVSSVNVFVLISGWFGIRPSLKGVFKFIYQILFFLGLGYIISLCLGYTKFSFSSIADIIQLSSSDWFIKSYFVLMILSPILNNYINLEIHIQDMILFCFIVFEVVFGWIGGGSRFFVSGFGPLHLIGIYLAGQYLHYTLPSRDGLFKKLLSLRPSYDLIIYVLFSLITAIFGIMVLKFIGKPLTHYTLAYNSPFVIGASIYFFMFFCKKEIPFIRIVNWLGASSFAVYLFHGEYTVRHLLFIPLIKFFYYRDVL